MFRKKLFIAVIGLICGCYFIIANYNFLIGWANYEWEKFWYEATPFPVWQYDIFSQVLGLVFIAIMLALIYNIIIEVPDRR